MVFSHYMMMCPVRTGAGDVDGSGVCMGMGFFRDGIDGKECGWDGGGGGNELLNGISCGMAYLQNVHVVGVGGATCRPSVYGTHKLRSIHTHAHTDTHALAHKLEPNICYSQKYTARY